MTHTVDTLMALAYKLRYAASAGYVRISAEALRAALTEALQKRDESIDYLTRQCEKYAGQAAQPVQEPLTDDEMDALVFGCGLSATARDIARAIELAHGIGQSVDTDFRTIRRTA